MTVTADRPTGPAQRLLRPDRDDIDTEPIDIQRVGADRGDGIDNKQRVACLGQRRDFGDRVEDAVRRLAMHDRENIERGQIVDGGLDRDEFHRLARLGDDVMHGHAAAPQPGAEIGAIGAGDDVDRRQAGPRDAGCHRFQGQNRLGLDEQQIGFCGEQPLQPVGERRIAIGRIVRDIEKGIIGRHRRRLSF